MNRLKKVKPTVKVMYLLYSCPINRGWNMEPRHNCGRNCRLPRKRRSQTLMKLMALWREIISWHGCSISELMKFRLHYHCWAS